LSYLLAAEPPHAHQGRIVPLPLAVDKTIFHDSQHDVVYSHVTGCSDEDVGLLFSVSRGGREGRREGGREGCERFPFKADSMILNTMLSTATLLGAVTRMWGFFSL